MESKTPTASAQLFATPVEQATLELQKLGVDFVRMETADLNGCSRSKIIRVAHAPRTFSHGGEMAALVICGTTVSMDVVVEGTGVGDEKGFPDCHRFPVLSTLAKIPWAPRYARVLCSTFVDGAPFAASPREVCVAQEQALTAAGYSALVGVEYEMYLLNPDTLDPLWGGVQCYSTLHNTRRAPFVEAVLDGMPPLGVDMVDCHAEYGPGQFEMNFMPAFGVAAADNGFTFKNGVKELARQHGITASFMSKPFADQAGTSCHLHVSLWKAGSNISADPESGSGLSPVFESFVAGLIAHGRALAALMAPTVNCYKRYVPGFFAPCSAVWDFDNRTVGVRVLKDRVECRFGAGAANPYLAVAGLLAAGRLGIAANLSLPPRYTGGDVAAEAQLPTSLEEALEALTADASLVEALGQPFVQCFVATKQLEISNLREVAGDSYGSPEFKQSVTREERAYYTDML